MAKEPQFSNTAHDTKGLANVGRSTAAKSCRWTTPTHNSWVPGKAEKEGTKEAQTLRKKGKATSRQRYRKRLKDIESKISQGAKQRKRAS